ncbi:hypothetical protein [Jiella mangrovi]|uniref:DUF1488 family protein n=1 Tax=Jiella mangrovi TaxID=2821407 RepID=A0ABS4BKS1_9HYPH|nr:hypothetical protein [Jiella mangrovi]MBP0617137.1 hypothetical protein [Jiella mangrovi]
MARYRRLEGERDEGQIVVQLLNEGDMVKAMIIAHKDTGDTAEPTIFPSEEMDPEEAFRTVENHREMLGDTEVLVKMEVGVEWDPAWGELEG